MRLTSGLHRPSRVIIPTASKDFKVSWRPRVSDGRRRQSVHHSSYPGASKILNTLTSIWLTRICTISSRPKQLIWQRILQVVPGLIPALMGLEKITSLFWSTSWGLFAPMVRNSFLIPRSRPGRDVIVKPLIGGWWAKAERGAEYVEGIPRKLTTPRPTARNLIANISFVRHAPFKKKKQQLRMRGENA